MGRAARAQLVQGDVGPSDGVPLDGRVKFCYPLSTDVRYEVILPRYRPRHLRARPKRRGSVVVGMAAAVSMSVPAARAGVHVVAPGETLSGIAARYGTTVQALAAANDLRDPSLILAGQHLRVPEWAIATPVHMVAPGETLSGIAARYGTTVAALVRANRIQDADLIVVGTRLRVPASAAVAMSPSRSKIEIALEDQAKEHGVEPSLVKAVAWRESGWKQEAVSKAGAIGGMQVMLDIAEYVNESLDAGHLDARSPLDVWQPRAANPPRGRRARLPETRAERRNPFRPPLFRNW